MIDRVYATKSDLVVYQLKDEKTLGIVKADRSVGLPSEMKQLAFPFECRGDLILGILPEGSELDLMDIRRTNASDLSFIHYYLQVTKSTDNQWMGKVVRFLGLTPVDTETTMQFINAFEEVKNLSATGISK